MIIFFAILGVIVFVLFKASGDKTTDVLTKPRATLHRTKITMDVERAAYQAFESLYIVDTSSNIETVKGRLVFYMMF